MTARIWRALEHPHVRILVHPTGRLIGSREPYDVDLEQTSGRAESWARLNLSGATAVALSPDHGSVATGSSDWRVRVWDVHTRRLWQEIHRHRREVTGVAFSPDGRWLASASADHTIFVQDVRTFHARFTISVEPLPFAVTFAPDSRTVAVGFEGRVVLWDLAARRPRVTLEGHPGEVAALAFAPDGRTLVTGGSRSPVLIWDLEAGRVRAALGPRVGRITALAFAPDGRRLVSAGRSAQGLGGSQGRPVVAVWDPGVQRGSASWDSGGRSRAVPEVRSVTAWTRQTPDPDGVETWAWARLDGAGRKLAEGDFRNRRRHGTWTWWHPNERKRAEVEYRDGVAIVPRMEWDAEGRVISPATGGSDADPV
jgi:WD40 repeat protein